jgi:hypothetical protein
VKRNAGTPWRIPPFVGVLTEVGSHERDQDPFAMFRLVRFLCFTAAALVLSAAPGGSLAFVAPAYAQAHAASNVASIAPPPLPSYSQPAIPGRGYIWVPGYWGWNGTGYYWVPAYWARPPAAGLLWTPGYWAWNDTNRDYVFHSGFWAKTVGFYGGINYGFGYTGEGYHGGLWQNHQFVYNRAVNDLGTAHVASYANQVFAPASHISYEGGRGGTTTRPTPGQLATARGDRVGPTPVQIRNQQTASRIRNQRYSANKGAPPLTAFARANDFGGRNTWLPWPHSIAGAPRGRAARRARSGRRDRRREKLRPASGGHPRAVIGAIPHCGCREPRARIIVVNAMMDQRSNDRTEDLQPCFVPCAFCFAPRPPR